MLGTFFFRAPRNVEPCTGDRAGTRTQWPYSMAVLNGRTPVLSYAQYTYRSADPITSKSDKKARVFERPNRNPVERARCKESVFVSLSPINTLKLPRALVVQTRREWRMANGLRARTPQTPQPKGTTNNRLLVRSRKSAPVTAPPLMRQCNANPPPLCPRFASFGTCCLAASKLEITKEPSPSRSGRGRSRVPRSS